MVTSYLLLSDDQSRSFAKAYEKHRTGNHVHTTKAAELLGSLGEGTRSRIFSLADLDRDGRLSLREFVYAMWLADRAKAGEELPKSARHHEQEDMTRAVERMLAKGKALPPTASLLPEAFSAGPVAPADAEPVLARLKQAMSMVTSASDAEMDRLADELSEARQKLNSQLQERTRAEEALRTARGRVDDLHTTRRQVERDTSTATRRLTHLTDELSYVGVEVGSAQDDLKMLTDLAAGGDHLSPGGTEHSAMKSDAGSIGSLKGVLAKISADKRAQQARLQAEIEKQRQTEQDRSLMVAAIEAERSKLSQLRAERMKLCEERLVLEREMAQIAQKHWEVQHAAEKKGVQSPRATGPQQHLSNPPARGIRTEGQSPVVYASTSGPPRSQVPLAKTDPRANTSVFVGVPASRTVVQGI